MIDFLIDNFSSILTFIMGGGLVTLLKMKSIRRQAEAEAMKEVQQVYRQTISDLREDKDIMKNDNKELRSIVSELEKTVLQNTTDINALKTYKCTVLDCKLRKKE